MLKHLDDGSFWLYICSASRERIGLRAPPPTDKAKGREASFFYFRNFVICIISESEGILWRLLFRWQKNTALCSRVHGAVFYLVFISARLFLYTHPFVVYPHKYCCSNKANDDGDCRGIYTNPGSCFERGIVVGEGSEAVVEGMSQYG